VTEPGGIFRQRFRYVRRRPDTFTAAAATAQLPGRRKVPLWVVRRQPWEPRPHPRRGLFFAAAPPIPGHRPRRASAARPLSRVWHQRRRPILAPEVEPQVPRRRRVPSSVLRRPGSRNFWRHERKPAVFAPAVQPQAPRPRRLANFVLRRAVWWRHQRKRGLVIQAAPAPLPARRRARPRLAPRFWRQMRRRVVTITAPALALPRLKARPRWVVKRPSFRHQRRRLWTRGSAPATRVRVIKALIVDLKNLMGR